MGSGAQLAASLLGDSVGLTRSSRSAAIRLGGAAGRETRREFGISREVGIIHELGASREF